MTKVEAINAIIEKLAPGHAKGETIAESIGIVNDLYAQAPTEHQIEIADALNALKENIPAVGGGGGEPVIVDNPDITTAEYVYTKGGQYTLSTKGLPNLKKIRIGGAIPAGRGDAHVTVTKEELWRAGLDTPQLVIFGSPIDDGFGDFAKGDYGFGFDKIVTPASNYDTLHLHIPGDLFVGTSYKSWALVGGTDPQNTEWKFKLDVEGDRFDMSGTVGDDEEDLFMQGIMLAFSKVLGYKQGGILVIHEKTGGGSWNDLIPTFNQILSPTGYTVEIAQ